MIRGVILHHVPAGSLPIYDVDCERYFNFDMQPIAGRSLWNILVNTNYHRIVVEDTIDCDINVIESELADWLRMVESEDGYLIFSLRATFVRTEETRPDGPTPLHIVAGMTFVQNPTGLDATLVQDQPLTVVEAAARITSFCRNPDQEIAGRHPVLNRTQDRLRTSVEEQEKALARSRVLLESCLSEEQKKQLSEKEFFLMVGRDGRTYKVKAGYSHTVALMENGIVTAEYCVIPKISMPVYDRMLAQKLMLEGAPDEFFKLANVRIIGTETVIVQEGGDGIPEIIHVNTRGLERLRLHEEFADAIRIAG